MHLRAITNTSGLFIVHRCNMMKNLCDQRATNLHGKGTSLSPSACPTAPEMNAPVDPSAQCRNWKANSNQKWSSTGICVQQLQNCKSGFITAKDKLVNMLCLVLVHHLPRSNLPPRLSGPSCVLWGAHFSQSFTGHLFTIVLHFIIFFPLLIGDVTKAAVGLGPCFFFFF